MIRPTNKVGQQPLLWLLFKLRLRKLFKFRYLLTLFILLILLTYLRLMSHVPSNQPILKLSQSILLNDIIPFNNHRLDKCNFTQTEFLLRSISPNNFTDINDTRPQPTIERLEKLFQILISHENKFREIFDYLGIFRFTDIFNTLRPYDNNIQRLHDIYCQFQRYITISNDSHLDINPNLISYLKQISMYLSDGFKNEHLTWNQTLRNNISKPVIILAANAQFYDTLQASMRTVDEYLKNYTIAIYDLGLSSVQLNMIKENCQRCLIIPFPFPEIEPVAPHIRSLGNFAWKPIVIQDAVQRFGSIIYGDTSIRYHTSTFDRLLIDNSIRGFSCRELPGHYVSCFTLTGTFSWFNETASTFDNIYIAEAGFIAVTDNFLSRLILKTWVTCALDLNCIAPSRSKTECTRKSGSSNTHRFDQSAMVTVLSFYFFPSPRRGDKSNPAAYDMYASIQKQIAEVRRFEGDHNYFTKSKKS